MSDEYKDIIKAMKFKFAAKALHTFDKATMVVVGVCWGGAILMVLFALYAVILSASTRRSAEAAAASEPILPKIIHKPIEARDAQPLMDRLKKRFPTVTIILNNDQTVALSATDGQKFHDWVEAMSYIDVMAPQFRWTIKELCVGKCAGGVLMKGLVAGERISFEAPQPGDKDKPADKEKH